MILKLLSNMQNKFILLCAATVALAACAKTEVTPEVLNQDAEITFLTAPVTKAANAETEKTFANTNVFQTAAFYDANNFAYGSETAESYITPSKVKYFTNVWKVADSANETLAKSYYWPKDGGKLSFFSWSLNKTTLDFANTAISAPSISSANGVKVEGYTSASNDDFMVADPAFDMTQNDKTPKYYTEGVPTLFRHKTALVAFKVVTKGDYSVAPMYQTFTVTGIDFVNVATEGTYTQYDTDAQKETWTKTATGDLTYFEGSQDVKYNDGTAQDLAKTATELFIPETYLAKTEANYQTLQVKYTVSRNNGSNVTSTKEYTENICLKEILKDSIAAGKKYVITLTFGLDEILWDPAVYEWEVGTSGSAEIK